MSMCRLLEKCALYNDMIRNMVVVPFFLKQVYCQQRSEMCVRLMEAEKRDVDDMDNCLTPWGTECMTEDSEDTAYTTP